MVFLVASWGMLVQAQPSEKPDPLEGLLSDKAAPTNEVRLHISLLKVPAALAAQALLADVGKSPSFWRETLAVWQGQGVIEAVTEMAHEGPAGHAEFLNRRGRTFRYIYQDMSSHYWDEEHEWEAWKDRPDAEKPEGNRVLQDLAEVEVGNAIVARVALKLGGLQAGVEVDMTFTPPAPDSRPVTAWPLPVLSAPRYFFRPWHLVTKADVPVNEIFLLGCQMEPPQDGQVQTGHVMLAFGRVTAPDVSDAAPSQVLPDVGPVYRAQSWTVAMPVGDYLTWLKTRRDAQGDAQQMTRWLDAAGGKTGIELLATSAVACRPGEESRMEADLLWHDATGWEPSGNPRVFSPLSCDGESDFKLGHRLDISFYHAERPGEEADPFAPVAITKADFDRELAVQVAISRPSAPARWLRCKTAFEGGDADDPRAIETAEADMQPNESTVTEILARPGQVSLVGACLKDGRVHASFLRVVEEGDERRVSAARRQKAGSSALTTWIIETPLSWRERLLGDATPDFHALGDELLASLGQGQVDCTGLITRVSQGGRSAVRGMRPHLYFGGEFLNAAPHAQGIYFNPRSILMLTAGNEVKTELLREAVLSWRAQSAGRPQVRQWGIWQPDIATASAATSYMVQPTQPLSEVSSSLELTAHQAEVVAMVQTSAIGAVQREAPRLRWHVVRLDAMPVTQAAPESPVKSAPRPAALQTVQALVVKLPAGLELPQDAQAAAALLLKASRDGAVETVDCVSLRGRHDGSALIKSGWDFYFTHGRDRLRGETEEDVFHASTPMPAGTTFNDQIDVNHRLVGCQLEIQGERWTLIRDGRPPEIVTETFAGVVQEWPGPQPDGPEWEQLPKVRVCVQRPIFDIQGGEGPLPAAGQASLTNLAEDTVLLLRVLR
ncbi:hypothetical protein [Prosthecobacter fusiformis]|nr:hypothetical protein [Prosthecobacter fusiformis]